LAAETTSEHFVGTRCAVIQPYCNEVCVLVVEGDLCVVSIVDLTSSQVERSAPVDTTVTRSNNHRTLWVRRTGPVDCDVVAVAADRWEATAAEWASFGPSHTTIGAGVGEHFIRTVAVVFACSDDVTGGSDSQHRVVGVIGANNVATNLNVAAPSCTTIGGDVDVELVCARGRQVICLHADCDGVAVRCNEDVVLDSSTGQACTDQHVLCGHGAGANVVARVESFVGATGVVLPNHVDHAVGESCTHQVDINSAVRVRRSWNSCGPVCTGVD